MRKARQVRLPLALALSLLAPRSLADPTPSAGPPSAGPPSAGPRASVAPAPPAPPAPDDTRALRFTGGIAVGGIGLISVIAGSVLGVRALVDKNQIGAHCNRAFKCDLTGYTLGSEAHDFALISTVTFSFGLPALAAGVGFVLSGSPKKPGAAAWMGPAPGGLAWRGRW
jgi:hypothetical protein